MAFKSVSIGKKIGLGFTLSGVVVLVLFVASYLMFGKINGAGVDPVALAGSAQTTMLVLGVVGLLLVCGVGFFVVQNVGSGLLQTCTRLTESTQALDGAVAQVTSSSQLLADATTGQAANLEETSSAVEELNSLTRNNADNTKEADTIMTSAREAFAEADSSIQKLTTSMDDITAASEQTQKIVKTIDEIAFQTNLLALNAAVEAARAGEAGAGFAVVADEVRNLAMRAAEAAKDTSVMIDATVSKVKDGTALVTETNELFYMASKASERVGALIAEIATASEEQASGIDQIGRTIHDMDQRTQGLAATSEESASATATLKVQVVDLEQIAQVLLGAVGVHSAPFAISPAPSRASVALRPTAKRAVPLSSTPAKQVKQLPSAPGKTTSAEVIPFDDDDFEDF